MKTFGCQTFGTARDLGGKVTYPAFFHPQRLKIPAVGSGALISASIFRDLEDLVEAVSKMSRSQEDLKIFC